MPPQHSLQQGWLAGRLGGKRKLPLRPKYKDPSRLSSSSILTKRDERRIVTFGNYRIITFGNMKTVKHTRDHEKTSLAKFMPSASDNIEEQA